MTVRRITQVIEGCLERRLPSSSKHHDRQRTSCAQPVTSRTFAARRNVACLALLLTLCVSGCEAAASNDDDDHHHHDHHRATFAESVGEIQKRSSRFTSDEGPTNVPLQESERKKLLEILERLPEVAADSELKKRDWDRVAAISSDLLILLQRADLAAEKDSSGARSQIKLRIAELEQLVPLSVSSVLPGREPSPKK